MLHKYEIKVTLTTREELTRGWVSGFVMQTLKDEFAGFVPVRSLSVKTKVIKNDNK